jgi:hypothetical protein
MANTYIQIGSTVTVGAGTAASIEFTSIPATYTDLFVALSGRSNNAAVNVSLQLQFNNDTASNYNYRAIQGSGSGVNSFAGTAGTNIFCSSMPSGNSTASTFGNAGIYIPNYAGSTQKSVSIDSVGENNATEAYANLVAGLWTGTAAITSIKFTLFSSNVFVQYSTASLYGVKNS